eukprot:76651-Alexandrium_andersonii.AAC.1
MTRGSPGRGALCHRSALGRRSTPGGGRGGQGAGGARGVGGIRSCGGRRPGPRLARRLRRRAGRAATGIENPAAPRAARGR